MKITKYTYCYFGLLSGVLLLWASSGIAQDTNQGQKRSIVKINPVQLAFGEVRLLYEHSLTNRSTLEGGISIFQPYNIFPLLPFCHYRKRYGGKVQLGYRLYFTKLHPDLYITPLFFYKYSRVKYKYPGIYCTAGAVRPLDTRKHILALEFLVGWQIGKKKGVIWEPYLGIGGRYKSFNQKLNWNQKLPTVHLGLNIGFYVFKK